MFNSKGYVYIVKLTHKNQHWIPRVYLKEWIDPDANGKVVHRYKADGTYKDYRPISRIFSEEDIYTILSPDGSRDLATEETLQRFENYFERARRMLELGREFSGDHRAALLVFIAAMRNRSPAERDHWQAFLDRVTAVGDNMECALERASPETRKAMARRSRLPGSGEKVSLAEWRTAAALPFGAWLLRHVSIEARALDKMSLQILEAPSERFFITSDNPVTWWDAKPDKSGRQRRLGLAYRHLEITMPLSPRYCALVIHEGDQGQRAVSPEEVDHINMRTLGCCDRFFLANSPELQVDWYNDKGDEIAPFAEPYVAGE